MTTILEPTMQAGETAFASPLATERHGSPREGTDTHLKLQRILVPVDFTPASLHALRYAARLAERPDSWVYLLHVLERGSFMNDLDNVLLAKPVEELTAEATAQLERLGQTELRSRRHTTSVRPGEPVQEILRAAESLNIDLIIMAAHDYRGLNRLCRANTIRQVERKASCPVLTFRCDESSVLEPTLWEDTSEVRVKSRAGEAFLKAFATPND